MNNPPEPKSVFDWREFRLTRNLREFDHCMLGQARVTFVSDNIKLHNEDVRAVLAKLRELRAALLPLMILKSQNCDGQIGWRGQDQRESIAGAIRVKDILRAEAALEGTTLVLDAQMFVQHIAEAQHGAGVINRPQGPCDCEACVRIREIMSE